MNSFSDLNAKFFEFYGGKFIYEDRKLWTMQAVEWKRMGDRTWIPADPATYWSDSLSDGGFLIRCKGKIFKVEIGGWIECKEPSTDEIAKAISEKLDLLEWRGDSLSALMATGQIYLGCRTARDIMENNGMLKLIHSSSESDRAVYLFVKEKFRPEPFLRYESELRVAYERFVK